MPPRPEEMGDEKLNQAGGVLYIGSKGKMLQDTYGAEPAAAAAVAARLVWRAAADSCRASRTRTTR